MVSEKYYSEELPVDRGWAWVICAAAFVCIFLIGNALQTLAVLFLDLVNEFDTSVTTTSLTVMFFILSLSFSSVISANYFVVRFDERRVTIAAGAAFASCTIGFYLSPNIGTFIAFAAMQGMSAGMVFIPSISIISCYFQKYRSIATTISNSGLCVASIVGPPVIRALSTEFGLRGALLILAGVQLHMIAAGLLLRPVTSYRLPKEECTDLIKDGENRKLISQIDEEDTDVNSPIDPNSNQIPDNRIKIEEKPMSLQIGFHEFEAKSDNDVSMTSNYHKYTESAIHDDLNSPLQGSKSFRRMDSNVTDVPVGSPNRQTNGEKGGSQFYLQRSVSQYARRDSYFRQRSRSNTVTSADGNIPGVWHGSLLSITTAMEPGAVGAAMQQVEEDTDEAESQGWKSCCCFQLLGRIFDPSLLRLWTLRVFLLSCIPAATNQYIFTYIPTIAVKQGATRDQSAMLLTITGSVDLVSRLLLGVFADTHIVSSTHIVSTSLVCLGILCQFNPLFTSFETMIVMAILMGLFIGTRQSLMPLALIETVGMSKMARGLSLATMVSTISAASHNPFLSAVMEATGSFQIVLHYCGGALILGGLLLLLLPLAEKLDAKNNKKGNQSKQTEEHEV